MQLPEDHHCPWRELCELMEQRFGGLLAQQQRVIEEQKTLIDRLTHEHSEQVRHHGEQVRHHSEQVRKLEALADDALRAARSRRPYH